MDLSSYYFAALLLLALGAGYYSLGQRSRRIALEEALAKNTEANEKNVKASESRISRLTAENEAISQRLNQANRLFSKVLNEPVRVAEPIPTSSLKLSERWILFVGAGLSELAGGAPLQQAALQAIDTLPRGDSFDSLRPIMFQLIEQDFDKFVQLLRESGQGSRFDEILTDVCGEVPDRTPSQTLASALKNLWLGGIISAAPDRWITTVLRRDPVREFEPGSNEYFLDAIRERAFFIAHLGTETIPGASSWRSRILDRERLSYLLKSNPSFAVFLKQIFLTQRVLFVGVDLALIDNLFLELEINSTVSTIPSPSHPTERFRHLALAFEKKIDPVIARYFTDRHSIELLGTAKTPDTLISFFGDFPDNATETSITAFPTIQELILENIGRFSNLRISWNRDTNVIVGENAAGKSTILKALAIACSGHDPSARDAARALLAPNVNHGAISLKFGGITCRIELKRRGDNVIDVVSSTPTPIQMGQTLILAFPPMRGGRFKAAERNPTLLRPHASDVLPLTRVDPDDRISDLKKWIIEKLEKPDSAFLFYQTLVGRVCNGFALEFSGYDPTTGEIIARLNSSKDGSNHQAASLPVNQFSEGTFTTLMYLGVIVKRLDEVSRHILGADQQHSNLADLTFILLMDEIDSSLHPAWQRSILHNLRAVFPKMQLFCTTHSPLVAGGAGRGEVYVVSPPSDVPSVECMEVDVSSNLLDQVTHTLFGLTTTISSIHEAEWLEFRKLSRQRQELRSPEDQRKYDELRLKFEPASYSFEARVAAGLAEDISPSFKP